MEKHSTFPRIKINDKTEKSPSNKHATSPTLFKRVMKVEIVFKKRFFMIKI